MPFTRRPASACAAFRFRRSISSGPDAKARPAHHRMKIRTLETSPFADQRPGTSGLRKRTAVFSQPRYLENFVQALFDVAALPEGSTLVVGGDGRFFNHEATQTIVRMAAANGIARVITGRDGLLSTPAASHLIRQGAQGGMILS